MTLPDPCTGSEIARRLRVSAEWWAHNRKRLESECGFPPPLPVFKRPLKWDPVRVEAWIRSAAAATPAAPAPAPAPQETGDDAGARARGERLARNSERLAGRAAE
jgi:hypothetical protein